MAKKRKSNEKKNPLPGIISAVLAVLFVLDFTEDFVLYGLLLLFFVAPIVLAIFIFRTVKKSRAAVHTHDRINHSQDITIHPKTGAAIRPTVKAVPHSPREHWQMQLDALLANGTIDKKEYRAMMNRKF